MIFKYFESWKVYQASTLGEINRKTGKKGNHPFIYLKPHLTEKNKSYGIMLTTKNRQHAVLSLENILGNKETQNILLANIGYIDNNDIIGFLIYSKKLSIVLGKEYKIKSLGFDNGKESNFKGKFYDKNIDIAVFKNNIELGGIGIKFITGNYKQNRNNYFENMLGETVNIKRVGTKYAQIIIIKEKIPYFSSDKSLFTKTENISDNDLKKYIILDLEKNEFAHKPDLIYINLIKTGDEKIIENNLKIKIDRKIFNQNILFPNVNCKFSEIKLSNNFSFKTKEYLVKHSNLENFLIAFSNYIKANEYGK